uniref:Poly [ADP-ribose] polymerase n=1 Tax=Lepisosteus oculatus TaxID=7918 RepID=W5MPP2_LEPOC
MTDSGVEERTVEVSGIPASVEDEILGLYFENARRSGGGPLASLRRKGDAAVLVFEDAEVAARVLSRGPHNLQNATLTVRKPAPKDRGKLLLRGINPQISMEVLELYVENVTGVGSEDYTIYLSPERDIALIQFQRPLSETEFSSLWGKVSRKLLDGAQLSAELIEQTDSILVENLRPTTSEDMLTLYFENKRGGGEEVKDVSMLTEGIAKVSFEDYEAVNRVIQRSHMLDGNELKIRPYFDFLQPKKSTDEQPWAGSDALETPHSDISAPEVLPADQAGEARAPSPQLCSSCVSLPDPIIDDAVEITGPSQLGVEQLKNQILESFSSIAQAHLPCDEQKATLLSKVEVKEKLKQNLKQEGLLAKYTVSDCVVAVVSPSLDMVKQASSVIKSLICSFTIPVAPEYECMLYSKEWTSFLLSLGCCCARVSSRGDQIEVTTLRGMEEEKVETVIAMEPGMLKYIQTHCHTLLADMDQVTIFPLEEEDVTGLRLHGNANACQIADELLRSVVSSVCTRTIVLNRPGVARFLVQEEAARILEEMKTKFQDIFEVAKKFESQPNFQRFQSEGGDTTALPLAQTLLSTDVNANDLNRPDREEAKRLIGMDLATEDLYTDREATSSLSDNEGQEDDGSAVLEGDELRPAPESAMTPSDLEEDAMLSLAIQYSMESKSNAVDAEDELLKVLELSKKMVKREPPSADPVLEQAIHMSLQDAIKAAHTAEIQVFAGYSCDLIRVDIALGKKVGLRQCEEKVEHRCLKNLSEQHRKYVDIIQRKHAVDIQIQGSTATIQGFKEMPGKLEYVLCCSLQLQQLLRKVILIVSITTHSKVGKKIILDILPDATVVCKESDEFQDVVSDFYDTIREYHNKIKVVKVEKLTNRLLYNQYKLKKASMLQSAADPEVERTLYHGTNETSVKEISIHGFNRSFCGKNATVYGQGVYFAVDSALSVQDQYSPPNADGHKFVFVAKVLTGDYTKGRHEMKTAPLKENTEMPLRYHSVVDTMDSPSLFVIFNDTQAYPEYLITCQKM